MKQQKLGRCVLAISMAVTGVALADMGDAAPPNGAAAQSNTMAVLKDDLAAPGTVRASKLIDSEVYDPVGKGIGKIKDLVLDSSYDKLDYAVVGQGTPGFNEKLLALPYKALSFGGPLDARVYAQVPKSVIDNAPGFDESKWPTETNADYYRSLDAYYNTSLSSNLNAPKPADQAASVQKASANLAAPAELSWNRRATKLIGRDVLSPSGEKLGDVKDLVLDTKTGEIRYAVLARGGGLEKSKYYAVPINQLRTRTDDKKLALDVSLADLKTIPNFDNNHWPANADPRWTTARGDMAK